MQRSKSDMHESAFQTTAQLLVSGGDARILPDPVSGLNKYGCASIPDPDLLAFASSTASTISQAGFIAVNQLAKRLHNETQALYVVYAREMQRIRAELLADVSDLGVELVFASSGTDAHLAATRYAGFAPHVVMVEEEETGSGVSSVLLSAACTIDHVMLRKVNGEPRPIADIDADVTSLVEKAVNQDQRVLLIMVDQSKTGLIAPGPECAMRLQQLHAKRLTVLVDACQFRIAPTTLRAYLQQGFMVAVTGSKFFTGPSFSAALLLPEKLAVKSSDAINAGLLLRWEAALVEWRRYRAVTDVSGYLQTFACAILHRLKCDPHFAVLAVPQYDRRPLVEVYDWDSVQTIFPFVSYKTDTQGQRIPLSCEQTLWVYQQLLKPIAEGIEQALLRCQLGQPVACGMRDGVPVSALRLCISARQVSDAAEHYGIAKVIDDAMKVLDKVAWLADGCGSECFEPQMRTGGCR